MAKVQIKSGKPTPLGGVFSIMEQFDALLAQTIDFTLGLRCTLFGYQYSEILRSLMCVYLCGGSFIEDISTHLMKHLSLHPTLRTCSADTILRAIGELTCKNITYKSATGKSYDFNTADKMNCLLIKALLATGQLKSGQEYDFDFDQQFKETEKHDAKPTYKKFLGYSPDHRGCWLCERGYEDSSKTKVENEDQDFHRPSAVLYRYQRDDCIAGHHIAQQVANREVSRCGTTNDICMGELSRCKCRGCTKMCVSSIGASYQWCR